MCVYVCVLVNIGENISIVRNPVGNEVKRGGASPDLDIMFH